MSEPDPSGWQRRLYYHPLFQRAAAATASWYGTALRRRAVDVTEASEARSCLVLAPHPDDETLGCGGTIRRKRLAGSEVTVAVATDGRYSHRSAVIGPDELAALRREESRRACAALGVDADHVRFLDFEENSLEDPAQRAALDEALDHLVAETEPDELLIPSGIDRLSDHRALNDAGLAAAARCRRAMAVYEYPIWMWDPQAWIERDASPARKLGQMAWRPVASLARLRPAFVRTDSVVADKRRAIDAYASQMTNLTGEETWATMDPRFIERFTGGEELFFVVADAAVAAR